MKLPPLRAASPDDEASLIDLLRVAHREAPYGRWSEDAVRQTVRDCLQTGVVIMSLSHGKPVGSLALVPAKIWWSDDVLLQDRWIFVHPQHRRAPHARALLKAARDTAQGVGMRLIIGLTSSIRTRGKMALFAREFGPPIGASFLVDAT